MGLSRREFVCAGAAALVAGPSVSDAQQLTDDQYYNAVASSLNIYVHDNTVAREIYARMLRDNVRLRDYRKQALFFQDFINSTRNGAVNSSFAIQLTTREKRDILNCAFQALEQNAQSFVNITKKYPNNTRIPLWMRQDTLADIQNSFGEFLNQSGLYRGLTCTYQNLRNFLPQ